MALELTPELISHRNNNIRNKSIDNRIIVSKCHGREALHAAVLDTTFLVKATLLTGTGLKAKHT